MKKIYRIILPAVMLAFLSCNETEWLEEEPLGIYVAENSFSKPADFNAANAKMYENIHDALYNINNGHVRALFYPSDVAWDAIALTHELNLYKDKLTQTTGAVQQVWNLLYKTIANANTVLAHIDNPEILFIEELQRNELKAEAMFFRAFAYRSLGILYGGVPLVLQEASEPKRDYVRVSKEEVMRQAESDLIFAKANLPEVNTLNEEGRLTKAAANHLLTEVYIILEEYQKAIDAATEVINNSNYELMKERFGSRMTEEGDVYWDLFRRDNQNRSSGNREGIWVRQYEYQVEGGGSNNQWPYFLIPSYGGLKDKDGKNLMLWPSNQYGGRGIGWFAMTPYVVNQIWEDSDGDIRNSEHNIIRELVSNDPTSPHFGKKIFENNLVDSAALDPRGRSWNGAIYTKIAPINNYPKEAVVNPETGLLNTSGNSMYTDQYYFRLAETYLLRAEAHVRNGDTGSAAVDINKIRERAKAKLVNASEVDLDFILDERARELAWEELRILTLMRFGNFVERVRTYNKLPGFTVNDIADHQNVWPIPFREIETNTEAKLEQNPGYF